MWWGGLDDEPTSGASSSANTTPPVDIMAEEALADESTTDDVSDISELKEQFAAQEDLLGHLKSVLKSNEDKLQLKEKEVQDYAIKLAKAKRGRMSSPLMRSADSVFATSSPMFVPSSASMSSIPSGGKISLLKQQLAEERVKENEELKSRQGLEEMVKQLQKELSERDALINQLEQMSVASFQTSPIHSPYVMSPGTTSPGDRSPDRTPPFGCSLDSTSSYFTSHYKSMQVDKDNKIIDLTEKNIDLERKLLDMEENLRAKEELVRARTAAVTLMSADLSAKGKSTLDQLEDTRTEMRKMQANFAEQEAKWREKNSCLQVEIENRDAKITSIEENLGRMEKVRFELSTKNAELQEKLVGLQTTLSEVREQREQESLANFQFEEKMKEKIQALERNLEMAEKSRNDRKEEFIETIKGLVNEDQGLLAEKLVSLENQLTELEEEKGNLQLKLVDYEEIATAEKLVKNEMRTLNEQHKVILIELQDTKEKLEAVTQENHQFITAIEDRDSQVLNFSTKLDQVLEKNAELSLSKVKLEMKAVELEEIKDRLEEEHHELVTNIAESRKYSEESCKSLMEMQKAHSALNAKMAALQEEHKKCQHSQRLHDQDMLEKAELINEQKVALSQLEKVLHEKTDEMSDLLVSTDANKQQKLKDAEEIQKLNEIISNRDEKILQLSSLLDENQVHEKMNALNLQIEGMEQELIKTRNDNEKVAQELDSARNEIEVLKETLEMKIQAEQDFKANIEVLEQKCQDYQAVIGRLQDDLGQAQASCDEKEVKVEQQGMIIQDMENEMVAKNNAYDALNETLESHKNELTALRLSYDELEAESVKNQAALEDLQVTLSDEKSRLIEVQSENEDLKKQSSQLETEKTEIQDEKQKLSEKLAALREKAKTYVAKIKQLQAKIETASQEEEKESQVKNLEEQLKEKQDIILTLEAEITSFKHSLETKSNEEEMNAASSDEINELSEKLKLKSEELFKLQEDNKDVIEAFEAQLNEKQDTILSLEMEIANLKTEKSDLNEEMLDELKLSLVEKGEEIRKLQDENQSKESDLQSLMETCSGLNNQLSTLSQDLSEKVSEKADLEAQLEIEKKEKEQEINQKQGEMEEMKQKLEKSLMKMKSIQSNYDSLVANQGDSKELIQERDKAKAKCDLLTEKFKKVLAKCKQQEDVVKEHEKCLVKHEHLKNQIDEQEQSLVKLEHLELEIRNKTDQVMALEDKLDEMNAEIELKNDEINEKENEILKKQMEVDEAMENAQELETRIKDVEEKLQKSIAKNQEMEDKIQTMENQGWKEDDIEDLKSQLEERVEISNDLEIKYNQAIKELDSLKLDHSLKVSELEQKLAEKENDASEKDDILETLRQDLSRIREEMKDATISKNKLIEEAHVKLKDQEQDMERLRSEAESQRCKIIELTSQVEQSREQKLADDMSLASVNDTVKILQSQLADRDAEIAQLGTHIQETLGATESCHAEKLQLKDQLDSLTIVAENLQSLQHQVHLKDLEIDQLKSEMETLRSHENRPPPDITQYQGAAPDVASIQSQMQPDLMSGASNPAMHHSMDLVQDNDGWSNDDWNDNAGGDAANWFDNLAPVQVQDNVEPEPTNEEEVQDINELQNALEAKEAECSALINEVDALVSVRETLEAKIEDLKSNNEEMQEKMAELESSLMTASTASTTQCIQCQPETKSIETSTVPFIDIPASTVQEDAVQSPPPSVFTWSEASISSPFDQDFFASKQADDASNFFNQPPAPQTSQESFSIVQEAPKDDNAEKIKDLEHQIQELNSTLLSKNDQLSKIQDQVQDLESTKTMLEYRLNTNQQEESDIQEQLQKLNDKLRKVQYEKTMLEDQINQLPTMDAFTSLQNVNKELSEESTKLKERLQKYYSNEEYEAVKKSNEDLKMKLASIGESQNEDYEKQLQELGNEVKSLRNQLSSAAEQQVLPAVTINEPSATEEPLNTAAGSFFDNVANVDASNVLNEPSIEKGVSASSYFDTFGANDEKVATENSVLEAFGAGGTEEKAAGETSVFEAFGSGNTEEKVAAETSAFEAFGGGANEENVTAETSVFEAFGSQQQQQQESENVAWYKSQLEQYQQAIVDWQTWSQTQVEETNRLKESLAFHEQNQAGSAELDILKAAVKAKEIEVEDLIETLDRVKAEKIDLEQEITELTMKNQDLQKEELMTSDGQEGMVDIVLYEETKQSLDDNLERLAKVNDELSTKHKEYEDLAKEKEDLVQLQSRLQNEIMVLKEESLKNQESFESQKAAMEKQRADIEADKMQIELNLQMTTTELNDLKAKSVDQDQVEQLQAELNDLKAKSVDQDHVEQLQDELNDLKAKLEDQDQVDKLQSELEQQKSILNDWNTWGQQKTEEYNQLLEAYNQYVESYAKLTEEINRLTTENEELKGKSLQEDEKPSEDYQNLFKTHEKLLQSYNEVQAKLQKLEENPIPVAFSEDNAKLTQEINRLTSENEQLKIRSVQEVEKTSVDYQNLLKTHEELLQSYNEVQAKLPKSEANPIPVASSLFTADNDDASRGWDVQEEDFLQQQSQGAPEIDNQVLELETEISDLRQKIRQEVDDKAKLNEELNAAKVKHGKLTLKVKQLTKELQTRKSASPASSAASGFDDSLDKAIQNELNERAKNAEKALKEAQQQVKDMAAEKERLTNRIDTLEAGNERFLEMKEKQDGDMILLRQLHQEMQSKVGALEWQLSEKEELIATLHEQVSLSANASGEVSDEVKLKSEVASLRRNVAELESNCLMLQRQVEELESALQVAKTEKEDLASQLIDAQDKLDNMIEEIELLQNVQVQYDSLKLKLEHENSEKPSASSENPDPIQSQAMNAVMQQEILQLRTYIASLQNTTDHVGQDQQIMASLVFERNRVTQLQKDLQNKDETLRRLQLKLDSESAIERVRHESGASSEVGRIMSVAENDLLMKNERLQYDLIKSVGERRVLSQQMENWKKQLTEAQGDQDEEEEDEENLRVQQEQAYRSVGALQLRVEELTLEVTKLLEERDTLQLRLSNVMRQYERHKESSSRASTACSTPIPFVDNVSEIKELKHKIDELSRLNYSLDVELQKERESREMMQAKLRLHGTPRRTSSQSSPATRSSQERDSPGPVLHI